MNQQTVDRLEGEFRLCIQMYDATYRSPIAELETRKLLASICYYAWNEWRNAENELYSQTVITGETI